MFSHKNKRRSFSSTDDGFKVFMPDKAPLTLRCWKFVLIATRTISPHHAELEIKFKDRSMITWNLLASKELPSPKANSCAKAPS